MYPESAQIAGNAIADMPQFWPRYHSLPRNPTWSFSKTTLSPVERSPGAGFISQRQTTPAAMNDTAMGKR
jgi:hypothetical protein